MKTFERGQWLVEMGKYYLTEVTPRHSFEDIDSGAELVVTKNWMAARIIKFEEAKHLAETFGGKVKHINEIEKAYQ